MSHKEARIFQDLLLGLLTGSMFGFKETGIFNGDCGLGPVAYDLMPGDNVQVFAAPGSSLRTRAGFIEHHCG